MKRLVVFFLVGGLLAGSAGTAAGAEPPKPAEPNGFEKDVFQTDIGPLTITFIGHGTLMADCAGKVIHIDPWTRLADYSKLPKADLILITHEHADHLDAKAVQQLRRPDTAVILTKACAEKIAGGTILANGQTTQAAGFKIEAVAAYNIQHTRPDGVPYHPKGQGNGYIITLGKTRLYVAGDTENTPEMKALQSIDIAFLPVNLPYTMTPQMAADAAKAFRPKVLYPYHYGQTDLSTLQALLAEDKDIEVRIRRLP
ncbi:MAG TPA: MBL fold metallo-hydrolase [Anaerohalosphaeraceae bacterium]|nr:MBL fold metallo-hydrolase [Phycisphaerae bacterium]HOK96920.1 MBL fold metallo-hydrolase [Anaerohalosphaeraceae bacterium]HOL31607.1 MBL fold metallo-hydrolase [Anaerohalosphaeraceae bacterium]HPO71065.1 MBL fold metallo-hydrolase [Anaerohalosphaeraceae bacterium]HRV19749.1 MBL fold metallo-hydrolase [Anaerohalosphaeraceae bacterium]